MSIPVPTSCVAGKFALIMGGLCHMVPKLIARDRSAGPLIILIFDHLRRLARRFAALAARAQIGTLPAIRRRRARSATRPAASSRARSPLPSGFAWLGKLMPETQAYGMQLQQLVLNDPEVAALIAACPQAGRILRSILWMTAIRPVPAILRTSRPEAKAGRVPPLPLREERCPKISPSGGTPPATGMRTKVQLETRSVLYRPSAHWPRSHWPRPHSPRLRGKLHSAAGPPLKA